MRNPSLNSLRMFDAAARHLNFRLAAEELSITQGAVAQQVRRLEADLGLTLFQRKARGLALTAVGRDYHVPVRRALAILDDATAKLRPETNRVTLSVTPSFATKWLVPRLGRFAEIHPDIDLQTIASEDLANFQSDGVDIAVRQGRLPFKDALQVTLLAPQELCAVCSPAYADRSAPIQQFGDFANHVLIQDSHNLWDQLFGASGLKAQHRILQFNQTALAMDAAANGHGITLAPHLLLGPELASGKLIELWRDTRPDQSGYYLVWPEQQKPGAAMAKVINWMVGEIGT